MTEIRRVELKERPNKPYVVSADIKILLRDWSKNRGFSLPPDDFFTKLRQEFSSRMKLIFPNFELVTEEELSEGLNKIINGNTVVPISLDRVYYQSEIQLDIARVIDATGNSKGLGRRTDTPVLLTQFRKLKSAGVAEIALVDDVIFSGDLIERVVGVIERIGIRVPNVYAGIGIKEGITRLAQKDIQVICVKTYDTVIDEICERDFYPGVPFSGRLVEGDENIGAPYILPFGNPNEWASIPTESQVSFSKFCFDQTIRLFEEIERVSGKIVMCRDLDRKVIKLPNDATRFVDALSKII